MYRKNTWAQNVLSLEMLKMSVDYMNSKHARFDEKLSNTISHVWLGERWYQTCKNRFVFMSSIGFIIKAHTHNASVSQSAMDTKISILISSLCSSSIRR